MEAAAADPVEKRAQRSRIAPASGSPATPPPHVPPLRTRPPRPTSPFGAGFRRGLLASAAVHALLFGFFAWRLLQTPAGSPPPGPLDTAFATEWNLEEDPELPTEEPESPAEPPMPPLLEEVLAEPDPRDLTDPAPPAALPGSDAGDAGTIGVGAAGSRRAPRRIRPAGGGEAAAPAIPDPPAPAPALAPPPPVVVDARPLPDLCAPPRYPRYEEERGVVGTVILRVSVSADGSVAAVSVEQGSGHGALDAAAAKAVEHWTFRPATEDGRPVPSVVLQPVTFLPPRR